MAVVDRTRLRAVGLVIVVIASIPAGSHAQNTGSGAASPNIAHAQGPEIDLGSVAEAVEHQITAAGIGVQQATDKLYSLRLDASGIKLALKANRGYEKTPSFRIEETKVIGSVAIGTRALWKVRSNTAERAIAKGIQETVTARDGHVVWEVVVSNPVTGDLIVESRVKAHGDSSPQINAGRSPKLRWAVTRSRSVTMSQTTVRDAHKRVLFVGLPKVQGSHLTIRVPAKALTGAAYPIVVDPDVGPEYSSSDPAYIGDSRDAYDPAIAHGGGVNFVVWNEAGWILGARVTNSGDVLDRPGIRIDIGEDSGNSPAVAWNGSVFLVTYLKFLTFTNGYYPDAVMAARIDSSGHLISQPFKVASLSGTGCPYGSCYSSVSVASDGSQFLVAYADRELGVFSARVQGDGTVLDIAPVHLSDSASNQYGTWYLSTGWDGLNFLVAWVIQNNPAFIRACRVSTAGRRLDGLDVANPFGRSEISVIGGDSQFLIVWTQNDTESDGVYGRLLNDSSLSASFGDPFSIYNGGIYWDHPVTSWDGTNYLAAWTKSNLEAVRIRATGSIIDTTPISVTSGRAGSPAVAFDGNDYFFVWDAPAPSVYEVFGGRLSTQGQAIDPSGILISVQENGQTHPALAWDGSEFLVVWEDHRDPANRDATHIYGARVKPDGTILDGSGIPIATSSGSQIAPSVAWNGSEFLVAWVKSSGAGAARVSAGGTVLDPNGITLPADDVEMWGSSLSNGVSLASDGTDFIAAWGNYSNGTHTVRAARISATGQLLDPTGITVATAPGALTPPSTEWGGSSYMVAWSTWSPGKEVRAARVSADGTVLDLSSILVTTEGSRPSVAWSGSFFQIAWIEGGVRGARLDQAGHLIDAAPVFIVGPGGWGDKKMAWSGIDFVIVGTTSGRKVQGAKLSTAESPQGDFDIDIEVSPDEVSDPTVEGMTGGRVGVVYTKWTFLNGQYTERAHIRILDESRDTAVMDSGPNGLEASKNASFAFSSLQQPATFQCSLDGDAFTACSSPATYQSLAEGSHLFQVRASTASGTGNPALRRWVIDSLPPDTTVTSGPPADTNATTATIKFTSSEPNSTFQCTLDEATPTTCTTPQSFSGLADGPHTFSVAATDATGNQDQTPARDTWTVDTQTPDTSITSGPSGTVNTSSVSIGFASTDAGSTFACSLDNAAYESCVSPKNYGPLADGAHTFSIQATDRAGNTDPSPATRSWVQDTTVPVVTITGGPSGVVPDSTAQFAFTASQVATFTCSLDNAPSTMCSSPVTYGGLLDGTHTFTVWGTNAAGTTSSATRTWRIGPTVSIVSGPSGYVDSSQAQFSFSADQTATFVCSLDGAPFVACTSPWSYSGLPDGSHTFTVVGTNTAGTRSDPASRAWTVDTTAPFVTITSAPTGLVRSRTAQFSFTADKTATFACSLDQAPFAGCSSPQTYTSLADGVHTVSIRATSPVGHTSAPISRSWTIDATPPSLNLTSPQANYFYVGGVALNSGIGFGYAIIISDGSLFILQATAADASPVTVRFTVDTTVICAAVAAPHTCGWRPSPGAHTVTAVATDAAGNTSSPQRVNVIVV